MKKFLIIGFIVIVAALLLSLFQQTLGDKFIKVQTSLQNKNTSASDQTKSADAVKVLAQNLEVPWAMDFLPDGNIIFTQRKGVVSIIDKAGNVNQIFQINVLASGESGLQGIAVDPKFDQNKYIYVYYTYSNSGDNTLNRVSRFNLEDNKLISEKVLVDNISGASNHDGGRLKFGPDGYLYITTGDAEVPSRAQDKNSLSGKILRIDANGNAAPGNPFSNRTYSYGHRNPQGITWDSEGNLWATEHGRSGVQSGLDELNLIKPGNNYGWPTIQGDETKDGMQTPIINSGANSTWAPAGIAFTNDKLYFGGLRGTALYEYDITTKELKEHFKNEFGRIREVILGPDNLLYITTSNKDGRGTPTDGDDKIIIINPEKL